jgi:hypothetical protein
VDAGSVLTLGLLGLFLAVEVLYAVGGLVCGVLVTKGVVALLA